MKNLHLIAGLALLGMLCAYACKRALENNQLTATKARTQQACSFETLSGDITSDRTLSAGTIYQLSGCVTVKSPATLTIPAGTVIQGIKSALSPAWLVIERGAKIMAIGTNVNPIIFTTDQAVNSRNPGDWGGIVLLGNANNNNGNALDIPLTCATYTGGGTNNADNSGTMQFVQVLFAGQGASNDITKAGLILNSVGTGTTIDHIQLAEMANDALAAYGGAVKLSNIVSYNTDRTDYRISFGNISAMQFLSAMRLNDSAAPSASAFGFEISNQKPILATGLSSTPLTKPIISNATVQGPNYCHNTPANSNFKYAVQFTNDGAGKMYNSVLTSWRTAATQSGLFIDGTGTIAKTASDDLEFSYNSFHNSGATPYSSTTWTSGCDLTMTDWISTGTDPCVETGNQFSVATLGYDGSFCNEFCGAFTSNFTLGTTSLSAPNYSWDTGSQFSHVNYRGAWGATDWTQSWTQWCPPTAVYCQ